VGRLRSSAPLRQQRWTKTILEPLDSDDGAGAADGGIQSAVFNNSVSRPPSGRDGIASQEGYEAGAKPMPARIRGSPIGFHFPSILFQNVVLAIMPLAPLAANSANQRRGRNASPTAACRTFLAAGLLHDPQLLAPAAHSGKAGQISQPAALLTERVSCLGKIPAHGLVAHSITKPGDSPVAAGMSDFRLRPVSVEAAVTMPS
jgi:hypothetical protein